MPETSQITACMIDNGLFLPLAIKLAPSFKRMLYYTEWMEAFPTINRRIIGDGYAEIERVDDFWEHAREINLFIFPDIYRSGLQAQLAKEGYLVWGSGTGDSLEKYRITFLRLLEELGLPVPPHTAVKGISALKEHLRDREDQYVKISKYRGTLETYHWRNWRQDEGTLDLWSVKFGPLKDLMTFIVCEPIDTEIEIGGDTYCIDGKFPGSLLNGDEFKDKGYLGSVTAREEMPDEIQIIMDAFAPVLKKERYRNAFSMEVRPPYFIDPCCRFPMPGSGVEMELISNLPEIIFAGAQGELLEPVWAAKFGAECVLTNKSENQQWRIVDFPENVQPFVKCGDSCEIGGRICFPPHEPKTGDEIGWIFSTGNSIQETIQTMKERVKMLPDGVCAATDSLFELLKSIREGERKGFEFSKQAIPRPEIALETK